jgi:hypothetical protein
MALCHMIRSCVKMFWNDTSLPIGQVNVVGMLTCYGLGSLVFEPWWGVRLSRPIHVSLKAHPAMCTTGTGFLFQGQSGWGLALTTHPLLVPGFSVVESYLYLPSLPSWHEMGTVFTFYHVSKGVYREVSFFNE